MLQIRINGKYTDDLPDLRVILFLCPNLTVCAQNSAERHQLIILVFLYLGT